MFFCAPGFVIRVSTSPPARFTVVIIVIVTRFVNQNDEYLLLQFCYVGFAARMVASPRRLLRTALYCKAQSMMILGVSILALRVY